MALERQLARWLSAGLISSEQGARIRRFEAEQSRPTLLYAVSTLAGVAIAIGIVSVIAANWDAIPGRAKIGLDLAIIAGLSYAFVWRESLGARWLREAGLVVLYGAVLASIGLIGQVYQLGGNTALALLVWSVITFPALAQGRSASVGFVWLLGLETTYYYLWTQLSEHSRESEPLVVATAYWAPLACLALGRWGWLERERPAYAGVALTLGWLQVLGAASVMVHLFYGSTSYPHQGWHWLGALGSVLGTAWLWYREGQVASPPALQARRWLLLACCAAATLPLLVPHGEWPLLGFLAFLGLWLLVALAAYRSAAPQLLHLASAVIGLRLLVGYIELFGSLLETGLGLILGGVLALLLTWVWTRQRRKWDRELGASPPASAVATATQQGEESQL
ncbi:MAG: hypothetical protein RL685_6050 [Pseudomonadota bacterium]|jgi:uncharacterized membrane protein